MGAELPSHRVAKPSPPPIRLVRGSHHLKGMSKRLRQPTWLERQNFRQRLAADWKEALVRPSAADDLLPPLRPRKCTLHAVRVIVTGARAPGRRIHYRSRRDLHLCTTGASTTAAQSYRPSVQMRPKLCATVQREGFNAHLAFTRNLFHLSRGQPSPSPSRNRESPWAQAQLGAELRTVCTSGSHARRRTTSSDFTRSGSSLRLEGFRSSRRDARLCRLCPRARSNS